MRAVSLSILIRVISLAVHTAARLLQDLGPLLLRNCYRHGGLRMSLVSSAAIIEEKGESNINRQTDRSIR